MEVLEDFFFEFVEGLEEDIVDKVVFLERCVLELEKDMVVIGE